MFGTRESKNDEIGRMERKRDDFAPVYGLPGGVVIFRRASDSVAASGRREAQP